MIILKQIYYKIITTAVWRYHEDKFICILKTLALHDLNTKVCDYAKEMYNFY